MNKIVKSILLVSSIAVLSGCTTRPSSDTTPSSNVSSDLPDDYYAYYDTLTGRELLENLHILTIYKHTKGVRYSEFTNYCRGYTQPRSIDEYHGDSTKNIFIYTGKLVDKSTSFTREHVWPCANSHGLWNHPYVDDNSYIGGGSDLYHVRPCDDVVNTARGNSKFKEFKSTDVVYAAGDGGQYTLLVDKNPSVGFANYSEPANEMKGDIARICMYVYTRYCYMGNYNDQYCGGLSLWDVFYGASEQEAIALCCKWNDLDPVDDTERLRNETIEKIQGNRNPFVDRPEYMKKCFNLN